MDDNQRLISKEYQRHYFEGRKRGYSGDIRAPAMFWRVFNFWGLGFKPTSIFLIAQKTR